MAREIKFRAWDKGHCQMLLGPNLMIDATGLMYWQFGFNEPMPLMAGDHAFMQFTGLKDKNGKEIYEGDIVLFMGRNREIKFCALPPCFTIDPSPSNVKSYPIWEPDQMEIIGNRFSNPDLLAQETTHDS